MEKHRTAYLYGMAIVLLWGLSFLSIKVAVREVPPMTMAAARFVIALLALPLVARMKGQSLAVPLRDLPMLALGGLTGSTLYFYGENHGIQLLSASESSLVISTIPVFTLLTERLVFGVRQGWKVYVGAFLSMAGVALIAWKSGGGTSSRMGYLYMGTACAAWVLYGMATKTSTARHGGITITFWQILFGLLGCLPMTLAESGAWRVPGWPAALNVLYLGLACSALGYWLYVSAMEVLGPGRTSLFANLIPVVAVAAAFLILGERLTPNQWAGGLVALGGVWLATTRGR
jgi:drug/metabolite transporter (DMT)-like permease